MASDIITVKKAYELMEALVEFFKAKERLKMGTSTLREETLRQEAREQSVRLQAAKLEKLGLDIRGILD